MLFLFTEVDLFSFDSPAPAPAAAAVADEHGFDAFQSAPAAPVQPVPSPSQPDPFGDFSGPSAHAQPQQFDAFGGTSNAMGNMASMNNAFGNMHMQQQGMMNSSGMMGMQQPAMMNSGGIMGMPQQQQMTAAPSNVMVTPSANDDDFGDFENASPQKQTVQSSDPFSHLTQLDSLTKNPKKKEDKMNEPIVATPAAAVFVSQQPQIQQLNKSANIAASFQGIDGLNKPTNLGVKAPVSHRQPGKPIMGAEGNDTSDLISSLSPQIMTQQGPQQQPQNAAMMNQMALQRQMMLQQQMMMQQQNGMMNPQMQQNNMMNPQVAMMYSQQMGMNPNMHMQGGMQGTGSMQGMGSMQGNMMGGNMMGGQPMGGQMNGQMGGQPMGGQMNGQTGGQPMGGWP